MFQYTNGHAQVHFILVETYTAVHCGKFMDSCNRFPVQQQAPGRPCQPAHLANFLQRVADLFVAVGQAFATGLFGGDIDFSRNLAGKKFLLTRVAQVQSRFQRDSHDTRRAVCFTLVLNRC